MGNAWCDYDRDGDLDLFVANSSDQNNFLYSNSGGANNWINILCVGTASNRSAIGAKVRVKATIFGNPVWQMNEISGGTYRSQNSLNAEFGLGDATIIDSIKIEWPSGLQQVSTNVAVNRFLTITEVSDVNPTISGEITYPGHEDYYSNGELSILLWQDPAQWPHPPGWQNPIIGFPVGPPVDFNNPVHFFIDDPQLEPGYDYFLAVFFDEDVTSQPLEREAEAWYGTDVQSGRINLDGGSRSGINLELQPIGGPAMTAVILNQPFDIASNSMTLSWSQWNGPSENFDRYELKRETHSAVQVSSETAFTGSSVSDTVFTDSGLESGTTYYYRVFVYNDVGDFAGSNEVSGSPLTVSPPSISGVPQSMTVNENLDVVVNIQVAAEGGLRRVDLMYVLGGKQIWEKTSFTHIDGNNYRAVIPGSKVTNRGLCVCVEAEDELNQVTLSDTAEVRVKFNDLEMARTRSKEYMMISVPGDVDDKNQTAVLGDELGEYDKTQWRLFAWDGTGYTEFEGSARFEPGQAFWIITHEGKDLNGGPGISTQLEQPYDIALNQGWNQIGSPYNFVINMNQIQYDAGAIEPVLYEYDPETNDYKTRTAMTPGLGYWIWAENSTSIRFRSPGSGLAKQVAGSSPFDLEWGGKLRATARRGAVQDKENVFGVGNAASNGWDQLDRHEPPVIGDYITLAFDDRNWEYRPGLYGVDIRNTGAEGYEWPFVVRTNQQGYNQLDVEWTWSLPAGWEAFIVDRDYGVVQNLIVESQYTFGSNGTEAERNLILVVGPPTFAQETIQQYVSVPEEYRLIQNMPNPFNVITAIRFSLPEKSNVTLVIYDVMGREVARLASEEMYEAGTHICLWDGKDSFGRPVSSGVYLYQLHAADFNQSRKMLLLH